MYNDNYETCSRTYVTLQIYCDEIEPKKLTKFLGLAPSETQTKGEKHKLFKNKKIKYNGWFLSTKAELDSKDCRRHIDFLADQLLPIKSKLKTLIDEGSRIDISCYWESSSGHGGPILSNQQLAKLTELGLDFWFDIY